MAEPSAPTLRFLGEIEIRRGRRSLPLPPSKKTRALLAYLVLSPRPVRRERLCSLLWDVTDDPRGALRWSLSKLRPLVDDRGNARLVADRDTVAFAPAGARVDVAELRAELARGAGGLPVGRLAALAREFRGEFLEGLELPGFLEFQAWCVAQREEMRQLQAAVLRALVAGLDDRVEEALPHARALVQCDPLDEDARALLIRLLLANHRPREAEEHYRAARQVLQELGRPLSGALERAWASGHDSGAATVRERPAAFQREARGALEQARASGHDSGAATVRERPAAFQREANRSLAVAAPLSPQGGSAATRAGEEGLGADGPPLAGRQNELARLREALAEVAAGRRERVLLLSGEPGVGKSRLLAELMAAARELGGTVLDGCAYEVEAGRPYGPWVDALRRLPSTSVGPALGGELAPLLPELGEGDDGSTRERLFGGVVDLLAARAHSAPPVVVVLDDVQWCDDASATLLHYVARMLRHRPLLLALAARGGELLDNETMCKTLRALRREGVLTEMRIGPLARDEVEVLVRNLAPAADVERVFADSGGNPLFALEVARAPRRRDDVSPTLGELVRDRLERLPAEAAHVLRWGAVLGQTFAVDRLRDLAALEPEALLQGLELLERHALLRAAGLARQPGGAYAFAHDVVRTVVYGDLSAPRRRLMHQRVAQWLAAQPQTDEDLAGEIAHHAAQAGEGALAARACVAAARRCLRVFANREAEALARRGLQHADGAPAGERVRLRLELHHVALAARRPDRLDEAARQIEALAEEAAAVGAVEHARLGFHMVSWLRWESGDWTDARRTTLAAEQVSRAGDEKERVAAMAEAARCLAIVERDLGHAESLLLEAGSAARRLGIESLAIEDGLGMLRLHQGATDDAERHFERARALARREGDHDGEFQALAHRVALEIERRRWRDAAPLAGELAGIAAKLRGGSEGPFAAALVALCALAEGGDAGALDVAIEDLRLADSKHRLAFVLTRAGEIELARGEAEKARARALEAARAAAQLESASEAALAQVLLARASAAAAGTAPSPADLDGLPRDGAAPLSAYARAAIAALVEGGSGRSARRKRGGSAWRT